MATDLEFDDAFFNEVMRSEGIKSIQREVGEKVLSNAKANAPVDSAAYKNGLRIGWVSHRFRDTLIVEGTDKKTLLIEAKTGNLARALKSAGRR